MVTVGPRLGGQLLVNCRPKAWRRRRAVAARVSRRALSSTAHASPCDRASTVRAIVNAGAAAVDEEFSVYPGGRRAVPAVELSTWSE